MLIDVSFFIQIACWQVKLAAAVSIDNTSSIQRQTTTTTVCIAK